MSSELIQEYNALLEHWEWGKRGMEMHDVPQVKLTIEYARAFLERWQGKAHDPQIRQRLAELNENHGRLAALLEMWFLEALHWVIDKRMRSLVAEHRFRFSVEYIKMMQNAPSALWPQLSASFHAEYGYDFNPERLYREAEAALDRREAEYDKALATLEIDWPERMNARLRRHLGATDPRELEAWKSKLLARPPG